MLVPTESVSLYQPDRGTGPAPLTRQSDCLVLDRPGSNSNLLPRSGGAQAPRRHRSRFRCPARLRLCQHLLGQIARPTRIAKVIEALWPPLSGLFEDDDGHREECDYRFRAKICPACGAGCLSPPAAARAAISCWWTRRQAQRGAQSQGLHGHSLRRFDAECQARQGERLEVVYHDEDGLTSMSTSPFTPGRTALVSTTLCASSLA